MASLPQLPKYYKHLNPPHKIGEGGYGTVYKIWNHKKNNYSALKICKQTQDKKAVLRFKKEIKILEDIQHPGIVEIEYADDKELFFIMEFLEGGIFSFRKKYEFLDLLHIFKQLSQALYFAHRLGIVHRDLKPQNILFDKSKRVKISDFGIVRYSDSQITATTDFIGTPIFMAPEQIENPRNVDYKADLWA